MKLCAGLRAGLIGLGFGSSLKALTPLGTARLSCTSLTGSKAVSCGCSWPLAEEGSGEGCPFVGDFPRGLGLQLFALRGAS